MRGRSASPLTSKRPNGIFKKLIPRHSTKNQNQSETTTGTSNNTTSGNLRRRLSQSPLNRPHTAVPPSTRAKSQTIRNTRQTTGLRPNHHNHNQNQHPILHSKTLHNTRTRGRTIVGGTGGQGTSPPKHGRTGTRTLSPGMERLNGLHEDGIKTSKSTRQGLDRVKTKTVRGGGGGRASASTSPTSVMPDGTSGSRNPTTNNTNTNTNTTTNTTTNTNTTNNSSNKHANNKRHIPSITHKLTNVVSTKPNNTNTSQNPISRAKKVHSESERDGFCRRVDFYDGQTISVDGRNTYEVGNYLGGGVAGVVYEGKRLLPLDQYPSRSGYNNNTRTDLDSTGTGRISRRNSLRAEDTFAESEERNMTGCEGWWSHTPSASVSPESSDEPHTAGSDLRLQEEHTIATDAERGLVDPEETVAIKILNPVGFRLLSASMCASAIVVKEGAAMNEDVVAGTKPMTEEHVWWLVNPSSKNLRSLKREPSPLVVDRRDGAAVGTTFSEDKRNGGNNRNTVVRTDLVDRGSDDKGLRLSLIAAYIDPSTGSLRELPLTRCIEIWGHAPFGASESEFEEMMDAIERVNAGLPSREESPEDNEDESHTPEPDPFPFMKNSGLYRASNAKKSNVYCKQLNAHVAVSKVPPKYIRWLRQRRAATKEIRNMMRIGRHKNVVHLYEVLELVQDSKSIMFLVLELVKGGELFDLISSNAVGTIVSPSDASPELTEAEQVETVMRKFFKELCSGIAYCHFNGIAHRDLKPENLLVHNETSTSKTLKIADFGLSSTFTLTKKSKAAPFGNDATNPSMACAGSYRGLTSSTPTKGRDPPSPGPVTGLSPLLNKNFNSMLSMLTCGSVDQIAECFILPNHANVPGDAKSLKRMTSIVGSPHYVAPEIISQTNTHHNNNKTFSKDSTTSSQQVGYDGTKADVWSAGVILYAMLFRSLPFGEDLLRCPRFQSFSKWYAESRKMGRRRRLSAEAALKPLDDEVSEDLGPSWFFPSQTSMLSKDVIVAMLNPVPKKRMSIEQVLDHPWMEQDFTQKKSTEYFDER